MKDIITYHSNGMLKYHKNTDTGSEYFFDHNDNVTRIVLPNLGYEETNVYDTNDNLIYHRTVFH